MLSAPPDLKQSAISIRAAIRDATDGLVERELLADLLVLSAVASEHLLVVGPPGTAKSAVVRRVAESLGGKYFEYLLGRFTEPSEIFGPVDLRKLREGTIETETAGMLPEAEIAFLDEVFLGSTAVLNTLLAVLNERTFRRGHTRMSCPLRVCVGASNRLPDDDLLAAFADRFLIHVFVDAVPDALLEDLLEGGRRASQSSPGQKGSLADIDRLAQAARAADLDLVRSSLAHCVRLLRKAGVTLYDRRVVKCQSLVAAAGVMAGRPGPTRADLWPIIYAIPTKEGQALAREVLADVLRDAENESLLAAAEDASSSPSSRAARLVAQAEECFGAEPNDGPDQRQAWILRLEAFGREIDAGFSESQLTPELKSLRARIAARVGGAS